MIVDEAKYLFIRLYLRKHKFIRLGQIDYEKDITDLEAACQSLWDFTELASDAADADLTSVDPAGMAAANVVDIITPRPAVSAPASGPSTTKSAKVEMLDLTMSEDEQEDNENASLAIVNASANEIEEQALAVIQEERMDFTRIADSQGVLQTLATDCLLDLLTVEELMKLGKTMRVSTKRNNTVSFDPTLISVDGLVLMSDHNPATRVDRSFVELYESVNSFLRQEREGHASGCHHSGVRSSGSQTESE
jgi:hypothetical protein